jgi:hypothetical protein
MTDEAATGEGVRLVACRTCGNRVMPATRRCPACGAREPTAEVPAGAVADRTRGRVARPAGTSWTALTLAALMGALVGGAGVFVMRPPARMAAPPAAPPPAAPELTPAPVAAPPTPAPAPVARSRSRGRADWIFFLKPGDRLTRMGDEAELGMVLRTEKLHTFPDGTTGPAYLLQIPEGGQLFMDADELERGARLR